MDPSSSNIRRKEINIDLASTSFQVQFDFDITRYSQQLILNSLSQGKAYEIETLEFMSRVIHAGDCFVDIGAHIGYFSLIVSKIVGNTGRVIAVEPEESNFRHLLSHISLNRADNIIPVHAAMGSGRGEVELFFNSDNDGGHALWDVGLHPFNKTSREKPITQKTHMLTLDSLLEEMGLNTVKAIKIDTEGAEVAILKGGEKTLSANRAGYIICEVNNFALQQMGTSQKELRSFMVDRGYNAYLLHEKAPDPVRILPEHHIQSEFVFNLLFTREAL